MTRNTSMKFASETACGINDEGNAKTLPSVPSATESVHRNGKTQTRPIRSSTA